MSCVLTIDLEDWQQLLVRRLTGRLGEPMAATERATHRLLKLLDRHGVRATFFVVGALAERMPSLVREIHGRGHEIASHSWAHRPIFRLSRDEFRDDVRRACDHLQQLIGVRVRGFRAPEFSIGALDHWCFDVLIEAGFAYDSSVVPVAGVRYGLPRAPAEMFRIDRPGGSLWEFPLATWPLGKWRIPVGGGSYYRLLPRSWLSKAIDGLAARGSPAVFYFHPYEFHDGTLSLDGIGPATRLSSAHLKYRLLHNFRTGRIAAIVESLLATHRFQTLGEIFDGLEVTHA